MGDEGIGIRIVDEIHSRNLLPPSVEIEDLGTGNMAVVHAISGKNRVVFVDCAKMVESPGTIRRFSFDEVKSKKMTTSWSAHESDLLELLDIAGSIGDLPEKVELFGIEPQVIDYGQQLSPLLESRLEDYVMKIADHLSP